MNSSRSVSYHIPKRSINPQKGISFVVIDSCLYHLQGLMGKKAARWESSKVVARHPSLLRIIIS